MKRLIFTIALAIVAGLASEVAAQGYVFRVLAARGQNTKNGQSLQRGTTLQASDQISVSSGGYLGLVHATGKMLEVKEPGNYTVSTLAGQVTGGSQTVASKYADFVMDRMSDQGGSNRAITGAVSRATTTEASLNMMLMHGEQGSPVLQKQLTIEWAKPEGVETNMYELKIKNLFGQELVNETVEGTTFQLDLEDPKFMNEQILLVATKVAGSDEYVSGEFGLQPLAEGARPEVEEEYASLLEVVGELDSALDYVMLAGFFEDNGLVVDANSAYLKAMELQPGAFDNMHESFLDRSGLR